MTEITDRPARANLLGPPERLHPLYLLTGLGQAVRGAWGILVAGAYFAARGDWPIVAVIAVLSVLLSIGSLYLRWLKLEYRVGQDELRIDSGWISRNSRAIPFDRVTDIDVEQGPVHRLFGLARVKLETGGSSGGKGDDGILHTIALERAEALREHVRARKGQASTAAVDSTEEEPLLFAMDGKRLVITGVFNFSLAVIAGLFGVTQTMGDALGFDPFDRRFWIDLMARSAFLQQLVVSHRITAAIGGTLVLILVGIATGLIRTMLREYGFRLGRTETGFRRRRGLLTLTDVSIPARRIQAALLTNGPIRRRFGWWELKLQSLARDGGKGDHVVAPLARRSEAATILESIDWPLAPTTEWRPVSRAYVTSLVGIFVPAALATAIALPLLGPVGLLWLAGAGLAVAVRWLDWKRARFALDSDALYIERGWWRHRRSILPRTRIQSIDIAESWWSRLFGICTLRLGVAGGSGFSDHHVPALSRADAQSLRAELLS